MLAQESLQYNGTAECGIATYQVSISKEGN